ncbi:hypothetical protein B0H14DRAFT_3467492 [Mycena olivaceomarginata]|nr:hypothetical protein B0H14DRAFT_3467492 [Mycena olivaceomarginata]
MDRINPWFFPGRFQFLRCFETEKKARFAVWLSMENFLPLLGYVAMGLWLLQSETSEALYRGEDPPDWRGQEERVGAIYRIESPQDLTPEQREQRLKVESMLASIMRSTFPIPIYLSWGKVAAAYDHKHARCSRAIAGFCARVPGCSNRFTCTRQTTPEREAFCERNSLRFSRWAVNAETLIGMKTPFIPPPKRTSATPIAPNHEPAPAVPAAPFPRLPPNSQQKKGETIQAFFIRRSKGTGKKMANEEPR